MATGRSDLHLERIATAKEVLWRVRQGGPTGRVLGTVVEEPDQQWRASMMIAGQLHQRFFDDLDAAAAWLLSIAPKEPERRPGSGSRG